VAKDEFNFSLDLFNAKSESLANNTVVFDLTNEVKEINVNEPVQVMPVTEMNQNGVIRYTLEEEIEIASEPMAETKVNTIPIEEELNFTVRQKAVADSNVNFEASPLEMSIEDTLRARAEERKRKLKDFNYKFNNPGRIDELEKEPAFKRQGLDVTSMPNQNNQSRLSLGLDSNDDVQLRSNNSFLHDNVD
jgi:cell division protein FtsZ